MNEDLREQIVDQVIERPQDRDRILSEANLDERDREELAHILDTADAVWLSAQAPPALADDPVAAMLGLLPDAECRLDSAALTRARKRARLNVGDVARRLRERGWEFDTKDVFRWETRTAADVPPAVVQAVAEIISTPVDDLLARPSSDPLPGAINAAREHPVFDDLVNRWARARRVSRAVAAATLESRMLSTVHRGEHPDVDQLLQALTELVASLEGTDRG